MISVVGLWIYGVVPDLARLTKIRGDLMYGRHPEPELMLYLFAYCLAYIVLLICFATFVTERREFP